MKKISALMITGIFLGLLNVHLHAQDNGELKESVIKPYFLPITFYKTTNLIFPYAIKSVDRGSKDVLAQKAKGVDNILHVKAGKFGFDQTNLTVITADGKLYSYILSYIDTPGVLNIQFTNDKESSPQAFFSNAAVNKVQIQADAETVVNEKGNINRNKDKSYGVKVKIDGLYIKDDVLFCRINLKNKTNINYGIDQLRFYIRDKKKSKRTATQELEVTPLFVKGDTSFIAGQTEKVFVYALPKFTIPDKKYLAIEVMEKSGGRHLKIQVYNKTILRAEVLP